jgi:hypothetical protein
MDDDGDGLYVAHGLVQEEEGEMPIQDRAYKQAIRWSLKDKQATTSVIAARPRGCFA